MIFLMKFLVFFDKTALHLAVEKENFDIINILLAQKTIDINVTNNITIYILTRFILCI